ncbi:MAG: DUF805 domain-containing protein [Candidatus Izemoplasmatales bacterium]|nr:DUF805 domain-containing protein [Candidatus Izemoplasmatales bacterium]
MVFAINFLISALLGGAANGTFLAWIGYVYSLAALIPGIAIAIRRLHDVGKSGWYLLWLLVPIVGWIFVVIALIGASK